MKVRIEYSSQFAKVCGCAAETVVMEDQATLAQLLGRLSESHGETFRRLALGVGGGRRPTVMAFVNGVQEHEDGARALEDGDVVALLAAISGGVSPAGE